MNFYLPGFEGVNIKNFSENSFSVNIKIVYVLSEKVVERGFLSR